MKQILLLVAFAFAIVTTNAQRLIALEHDTTTTFHQYLDSAMYYAANGDNIYLPGGTMQLSPGVTSFIIDKAVAIYGTGYHPDSSGVLGVTSIGNTFIVSSASGGELNGIRITSGLTFGSNSLNSNVNGFTIKRCYIAQGINFSGMISPGPAGSNILISECWVKYIQANTNFQNTVIEKSLIGDTTNYYGNILGYAIYWSNCTIRNNIIVSKNGQQAISQLQNSTIENNIFVSPVGTSIFNGLTGSVVLNNISIGNQLDFEFLAGLNTYSGNLYNQSFATVFQNYLGGPFSLSNNFHLTLGCAGIGAGTDGTDIGIYGTSSPFKEGGIPINPHIVSKSVGTHTTLNGMLQINVKVKAQDN